MLKSKREYIAISDDGAVRRDIKSDRDTFNFGPYENIKITLQDGEYLVAKWEDSNIYLSWEDKGTFDTEYEAIMYGLTLI